MWVVELGLWMHICRRRSVDYEVSGYIYIYILKT